MDVENRLRVTRGRWGGVNWEIGTDRHTLMYKIENQQQPALQHRECCSAVCHGLRGKVSKEEWMYAYV